MWGCTFCKYVNFPTSKDCRRCGEPAQHKSVFQEFKAFFEEDHEDLGKAAVKLPSITHATSSSNTPSKPSATSHHAPSKIPANNASIKHAVLVPLKKKEAPMVKVSDSVYADYLAWLKNPTPVTPVIPVHKEAPSLPSKKQQARSKKQEARSNKQHIPEHALSNPQQATSNKQQATSTSPPDLTEYFIGLMKQATKKDEHAGSFLLLDDNVCSGKSVLRINSGTVYLEQLNFKGKLVLNGSLVANAFAVDGKRVSVEAVNLKPEFLSDDNVFNDGCRINNLEGGSLFMFYKNKIEGLNVTATDKTTLVSTGKLTMGKDSTLYIAKGATVLVAGEITVG